MKNRFMGKSKVVPAVCFVLIAVLSSSCGILPKINTNPANRTQETPEQISFSTAPSGNGEASDPTETEEILDPFEQQKRDMKESKETFFRFFDEAYDQYLKLQDIDLSDVLDMSYEPCTELAEALQQAVEERRTAVKNGTASIPEKLPYDLIVSGTTIGGGSGENDKFAVYTCVLKPLAEKRGLSDEEYLSQYPPFLKFGVNCVYLYKHKTDGKWSSWKIENFYEPYFFMASSEMVYQSAVLAFYEEAWKQYAALEYTGLQGVMDEASEDYQAAEALLKKCIEERKAQPESGTPEEPGYRIRIIETTLNAPGGSWEEIGTVRFELEPDLKEGESPEEQLKQYPAFMEFGEHCWSIHAEQGEIVDNNEVQHYLIYSIERQTAVPESDSSVKSIVSEELEQTVMNFFREAYLQYLNMEDADLSGFLDMSKEECVRAESVLQKAIEKRREEKADSSGQEPEKETEKANEGGDSYPEEMNPWWTEPLNSFYEAAGLYKSTDDPRSCRGYLRFDLHMWTKEAQEAYVELEREYSEKGISDQLPPPVHFTDEECREYFKDFLPFMGAENAFSFNWDDGTCKIDGFDAWEKFEGE